MFYTTLARRAEGHLKVIDELYNKMVTSVSKREVINNYNKLVKELKRDYNSGYLTRESYDLELEKAEDGLGYSLNLCIFS